MTVEERIEERNKLLVQIDEKANELKELVSQLEDQRVDFEEDEEYVYYNDVVMETSDLRIYEGSNWYHFDELYVSSIFVEDDKLYFAADYCCYTHKGSWDDGNHYNYIPMEFLKHRTSCCGNEAYLLENLKFFISILKGCDGDC